MKNPARAIQVFTSISQLQSSSAKNSIVERKTKISFKKISFQVHVESQVVKQILRTTKKNTYKQVIDVEKKKKTPLQ